jgi:predicted nucleic acid-binding protein
MLLDTSGLFCLLDRNDLEHKDAVSFYAGAHRRLIHNYILAEFVPLAQTRGLARSLTLEFSGDLLTDRNVETVWVGDQLHRQALELLQNRRDKSYSLCDAVSFLIMRERHISEALTTDRHFAQEGFQRLLK